MSKVTYILAFALIGQTALIAARELGTGKAQGSATGKTAVFPGLTLEQIARVKLSERDGASIELARADKGWVIASAGNYPAKSDAVEKVITKIVGLESTGVAASSASSHAAFEVSDRLFERDVRMLDASGAEKAHILLGRGVAGGQFVRRADQADVLRVDESLTWQASTAATTYIETQLVKLETSKVKSITLRKGAQVTVALVKEGEGWKVTTPADLDLDKTKVNDLLAALGRVYAVAPVGETKPEFGLDGADAFTAEAELEGGAKVGVTFGATPPTAGRRYARPVGSSMVAEVAEDAARSLEKEPADLKAPAVVKPVTPGEAPLAAPGAVTATPNLPTLQGPGSSGK